MNKKIAILTKNYSSRPRDVGDINALALYNNLKGRCDVNLIYLKSDIGSSNDVFPIQRALLKKYDIIYASSPKRFYGVECMLFAFLHFKPLFISIFDSSLAPITKSVLGGFIFRLMTHFNLIKVFSVSKFQKKLYESFFSIDPPTLPPCLLSFGYNKLTKPSSPPTILFIGSTNNEKRGIDTMLRAANKLTEKYPNLQIRILNKFAKKERWSEVTTSLIKKYKLDKNVHNIGYIKNMSEEYKKAWVYVLPFKRSEYIPPLPFTMIEAVSYGVPTISTNIKIFEELIPKSNLIDPEDYKKLQEIIDKIFSKKSRVKIDEEFFPEEVAKKFIMLTSSS